MKRCKLALIIIFVAIFGTLARTSANSGAPPLASTGAPGEQTCTSCHNSFAVNSGRGSIRLSGLPREFKPGETYSITIQLQDEEASRWGFELTVLNDKGERVGTIMPLDVTLTDLQKGSGSNANRDYLIPTIAGNFTGQVSQATWQFDWKAPSQGTATFYLYGVAANSDSSPRDDRTYSNVASTKLFVPRPPTLNFINPANGTPDGGTTLVMGGENYQPGIIVSFDGIDAQTKMLDELTLQVVTPPHEPGPVDVKLTNPDGLNMVFPNAFTYDNRPAAAPMLLLTSPDHGPTIGDIAVKVNGSNFVEGARVIWDGRELPTTFMNTNFLSVKLPLHNPGVIPVSVINPDGQIGELKMAFTYEGPVPPPEIKLLSPDSGVLSAGGAPITIRWSIDSNGSPLQRLLLSTDGGKTFPIVLASNLKPNVNQFNWAIPEDLVTDRARFRLEAAQPETTVNDDTPKDLKIVRAPQIDRISPATSTVGKTRIDLELTGNNFAQGAIVEMDGVKLKVLSASSTLIKIKKAPHNLPGSHLISVRNPNGGVSRNFIFTVAQ